MSSPPPSAGRTWRVGVALGALALLAGAAGLTLRSAEPIGAEASEASTPRGGRAHRAGSAAIRPEAPEPAAAEPSELSVRVTFGDAPVAGARVLLVPLDAAHGSVAPACACAPDGGGLSDIQVLYETQLGALELGCGDCAASSDALFELAERGAGFLSEAEATTDEAGLAHLAVSGTPTAMVGLWVQAVGFRPAAVLTRPAEAKGEPQQVELSREAPREVRIEDVDGNLVREAELAVFSDAPFRPLFAVLSGATFRLGGLPTGVDVHLLARAPGFLADHALLDDADEDGPLVLTLSRPHTARGRVLHGDEPVAGALVHLSGDGRDLERSTTSDADGRFTFTDLPLGSYTLTGDHAALHGELDFELAKDPGELALLLTARSKVSGVVTDKGSGKPLSDVQVELRGEDDAFIEATSDERGAFELDATPGKYTVHAADAAHRALEQPLAIVEGQAVHLALALDSGNALTGTLVDGRGQPVFAADVSIETASDHGGDDDHRSASTYADGSFELRGLSAGPHVLTARVHGHPRLTVPVRIPAEGPLALTLRDGSAVEGLVLGPDGPVAHATVELASDRHGSSAETDAAGHFRLDGLPEGTLALVAAAAPLASNEPLSVAVREGETAHVEIHLAAGLELRGRVVDDTGKPVGDAMVEAYAEDAVRRPMVGRNLSATSAADGQFTLDGLHAGSYRVFAYHQGLAQNAPVPAPAGKTDLELVLQRSGTVSGRVVSKSGEPVRKFSVEGQDFHAADGRFNLSSVAPDSSELFVEGAFPTVRLSVQVQPGQSVDLGDVVVDDGQTLGGRVLASDGRPAPGVEVTELPPGYDTSGPDDSDSAIDPILDSPRTVTTDADGAFAFDHLRPGMYLVQASSGSASSTPIRGAPGTELELRMEPGAVLRGRASLSDGSPVDDGTAIFVGGAVTAQTRVVGGQFELSGLPAGSGQVLVTGYAPPAGHVSASHTVTLASGQAADVTVTLGAVFRH